MQPPVLIITGYGLNCEAESRYAWERAGAKADLMHVNDVIARPDRIHRFGALMFIGGFSFGDHMTSGHVFAHKLRHHLRDELGAFVQEGGLILGVCNGFQIMTKLGLVPAVDGDYFKPSVSLLQNDCGSFQNFWVRVRFESESPCIFTRGLTAMDLPIRHGEGKLFPKDNAILDALEQQGCVPCRYVDPATGEPTREFPHNPNGSVNAIAGLCDPTGRIFGLMPHPEAFLFPEQHPLAEFRTREADPAAHGDGLLIFQNAVRHLNEA
ncbi:MAG TPA: phosphoribosylformylglycinamidine synthase subunit PurQ [Kiritimatiellia bacterium]|nr:phosphoribosylformylglycinamidine synthase subunit PurQ [Kiritimatiellia bacterium]HMO98079.1 phosphoribosylformylglycinamidine synthase subunit PurQ [Kiritimatiellia bacterium]HMP97354.1 phosphoribosylformylglycinamidine synthase subunit PurQ [Kiritimatiellia bacterium]